VILGPKSDLPIEGEVFERSGSWYLRYYRDDFANGQTAPKRLTKKLVRRSDEFRSKKDVLTGCARRTNEILAPINERREQPEGAMTLATFTEERFLKHIEEKIAQGYKKPSTLKFYKDVYNNHLKDSVGSIALRDFATLDAQNLFDEIDRTKDLSHKSLQRIQTGLSAIFTLAKQRNLVQANPVQGSRVEGRRTKPKRYAYTHREVLEMISSLRGRAATVVAVAGFTGLRLGEIRGLKWQDYDGETLSVNRSVWRTQITSPKTEASGDKVPVVTMLRVILNEHHKSVPNAPNAFIFAGERKGAPLNLANLVRREMTAVVEKGKWHGWHGFRRGLATRLHEAQVQVEVIQEILRHSDPKVTQDSYIVIKSNATTKAMQKVDASGLLRAWRKSSR
jgi:integrase